MNKSNQEINLSKLTGDDYQKMVFGKLVKHLFDDPNVLTIENYAKGPVDYIVREAIKKSKKTINFSHYFECKNYSRSIELDNVAKIMIVAVLEKPATVNIVSNTPLQPQIKNYAAKLFKIGDEGNPLFEATEFCHWQTDLFLNIKQTEIVATPLKTEKNKYAWWLSECLAFSNTEIASFESNSRAIEVMPDSKLLLSIAFSGKNVDAISLQGLPENSWGESGSYVGNDKKCTFWIDAIFLQPENTYSVKIQLVKAGTSIVVPVGNFLVAQRSACLPELREDEIDDLSSKIGPSGRSRLILVSGDAGAGKTHLIEKVAERLRLKSGFDVIRFTISDHSSDNFVQSILRNCLMPPMDQNMLSLKENSLLNLAQVIESEILRQSGGGSVETDLSLLVRTVTQLGPKIIVLRDCHLISGNLANQIWVFISTLDDASWGGIRLILEYRQPDGSLNIELKALIQKINLKIHKSMFEQNVAPLSKERFSKFMRTFFKHTTDELSDCLMQRTGGLPLFIDSYIRRLINNGFAKKDDESGYYEIVQPAQVLVDTFPPDSQGILVDRVKSWLTRNFPENWNNWSIMLGLLAMAEDEIEQSLIRDALSIDFEDLKKIQPTLQEAGIGYLRYDGEIVFAHDLLKDATARVGVNSVKFEEIARSTADKILCSASKENELKLCSIRIKIFTCLNDRVASELELRHGIKIAKSLGDYGHLISFLTHILSLLNDRTEVFERLNFLSELAWATWVSDSLRVARERYRQVAEEAERISDGNFSICEAIATDAYRRVLGIDLELVEPLSFITNTTSLLNRRQTLITFNSILNRLVLFCARFGFPSQGFDFSRLAFRYIGDGMRENEGAVICAELGGLFKYSCPTTALNLFKIALSLAMSETERAFNMMEILINESLFQGLELDDAAFDSIWKICIKKRFAETIIRAAMLRGTLFLRKRDLKNAKIWIDRTISMIKLYHMVQFEMSANNDQLLLLLMMEDYLGAKNKLSELIVEFQRIEFEIDQSKPLIDQAFQAACNAAKKLPEDVSLIPHPSQPPDSCNPMDELKWNIIQVNSRIFNKEGNLYSEFNTLNDGCPTKNRNRIITIDGIDLILGIY